MPTYGRAITASSKNYRYSVNMQVVINANTQPTIAVGDPMPGNRHDSRAYRDSGAGQRCAGAHVMSGGGYQGSPGVIMPYRKPRRGTKLAEWKEELNTVHKCVRARVEHALCQMRCWNILRNCRRTDNGVHHATAAAALMPDLAMTH